MTIFINLLKEEHIFAISLWNLSKAQRPFKKIARLFQINITTLYMHNIRTPLYCFSTTV